MTTNQHVADMIDHHLTTHGITIDPTQRDRLADLIDHYVADVHVNEAEAVVINELATPSGQWTIAYEVVDDTCECEIPWTGMDPECIACHDTDTDDPDLLQLIGNHLTPIIHQLLTT